MNSSKPPAKYSGVNLAQLSSSSSPLVVDGRARKNGKIAWPNFSRISSIRFSERRVRLK